MTKGYWIANNLVHDNEAYKAYQKANAGPLKEYGGKFLVRAGRQVSPEGVMFPRSVVIEFPSYADAVACYESVAYQEALTIRQPIADTNLIIAEGYDE
ncbi:MAG: DUF1330 domain-containing protein [Roseobacter sp.]|uniref:DUF1330 domain-containing protein n=1 Tax=Rhodobacterales TaxID=204455 RepID=UPI00327D45EE